MQYYITLTELRTHLIEKGHDINRWYLPMHARLGKIPGVIKEDDFKGPWLISTADADKYIKSFKKVKPGRK